MKVTNSIQSKNFLEFKAIRQVANTAICQMVSVSKAIFEALSRQNETWVNGTHLPYGFPYLCIFEKEGKLSLALHPIRILFTGLASASIGNFIRLERDIRSLICIFTKYSKSGSSFRGFLKEQLVVQDRQQNLGKVCLDDLPNLMETIVENAQKSRRPLDWLLEIDEVHLWHLLKHKEKSIPDLLAFSRATSNRRLPSCALSQTPCSSWENVILVNTDLRATYDATKFKEYIRRFGKCPMTGEVPKWIIYPFASPPRITDLAGQPRISNVTSKSWDENDATISGIFGEVIYNNLLNIASPTKKSISKNYFDSLKMKLKNLKFEFISSKFYRVYCCGFSKDGLFAYYKNCLYLLYLNDLYNFALKIFNKRNCPTSRITSAEYFMISCAPLIITIMALNYFPIYGSVVLFKILGAKKFALNLVFLTISIKVIQALWSAFAKLWESKAEKIQKGIALQEKTLESMEKAASYPFFIGSDLEDLAFQIVQKSPLDFIKTLIVKKRLDFTCSISFANITNFENVAFLDTNILAMYDAEVLKLQLIRSNRCPTTNETAQAVLYPLAIHPYVCDLEGNRMESATFNSLLETCRNRLLDQYAQEQESFERDLATQRDLAVEAAL